MHETKSQRRIAAFQISSFSLKLINVSYLALSFFWFEERFHSKSSIFVTNGRLNRRKKAAFSNSSTVV